jgi:hypothetical protein
MHIEGCISTTKESLQVQYELPEWYKKKLEAEEEKVRISAEIISEGAAALRGWVKTADRLPEGGEHDEILGLYKGLDYLLYDIVQIGWLRLHPEMYVYWTHLPKKPEVE